MNTSDHPASAVCLSVEQAIDRRFSCRAFTAEPVARATVEDILRLAARAPSGTNIQPWQVWVLGGEMKSRLSQRLTAAFDDPEEAATHSEPYAYYPRQWTSPYIDRRREVGKRLYGLLGIQKGDAARMHAQFARNYVFFDAPWVVLIAVNEVMEQGAWLDCGMFMQNLMLAAKGKGLDTCPQLAPVQFHRIIHEVVGIPASETLLCAIALGHADLHAAENQLRTERAPLEEWVKFCQ